eukprot:TRINITY_DN4388_c0_g1_i2.p2 TRINITY_DN4388_c0_g1~~TRINITY_DN4388_c0_g1_i2.p2  ORF type:complete len:110 (-),score=16.15 TRINITY_DN4388_c0_g1_i2:276-605(-)
MEFDVVAISSNYGLFLSVDDGETRAVIYAKRDRGHEFKCTKCHYVCEHVRRAEKSVEVNTMLDELSEFLKTAESREVTRSRHAKWQVPEMSSKSSKMTTAAIERRFLMV